MWYGKVGSVKAVMGWYVEVGCGKACGKAVPVRLGRVCSVLVRHVKAVREGSGVVWRGPVRLGKAVLEGSGEVRSGAFRLGKAVN
tara:strand:- start:517 stop:771 length:255 start_codon:yes stop_codon:yes gene_type:complete